MTWEKVKLGDCCTSITDGDHQAPPVSESGIPFIIISDIDSFNQINFDHVRYVPIDYYNKLSVTRKPKLGDILYTVKGSFGIPALVRENTPFTFQRDIAILRPLQSVSSKFLYYLMKSKAFYHQADSVAIGSAQRAITLSALRDMEVHLPERKVQDKIASILSAYDDLIENNRRQMKLLEEAAERLYKEWFVKFHYPGSSNDGNFVPEDWKIKKTQDVCETIGGGTPSTKVAEYYKYGDIPWVTPTDLTNNDCLFLLDTEKKITQSGLSHSSAKMLPPYTILMTSRATIGFFAICDFSVCTNQGFISCIPRKRLYLWYLLYNLKNRVDEVKSHAGGSTYLEISKSVFRQFDVIIPDDEILNLFNCAIEPLMLQIKSKKKGIVLLQEARDRLLPKLMSGEVEV